MKKNKNFLCFLTSLISFLLSLGAAEIYVRYTTPYLIPDGQLSVANNNVDGEKSPCTSLAMYTLHGKRLIPDNHVTSIDEGRKNPVVQVNINSHGFRDQEMAVAKKSSETRIMVLGDSITLSLGYPLEETFSGQMELSLNRAFPGHEINVINAGVDGIGLTDELDILVDNGIELNPDVVMIQFYLNDSQPPDEFGALLANPGWLRRSSVLAETVFRQIKKRQWLCNNTEHYPQYIWTNYPMTRDILTDRKSFLSFAKAARLDWGAAWENDSWETIEQCFRSLEQLSREHDFRVVIVAFPVVYQVIANFLENTPQTRLATMASRHGFYFYDLLPVMRNRPDATTLFEDHCHLTDQGHRLVGNVIAEFMPRNLPWKLR